MASNKQEWLDAFKHLRLHFSLLLMPVYLFALSQTPYADIGGAGVSFFILHLLIYPASNAFNSDLGSVGGLENPPPSNPKMLWLANILDSTYHHWVLKLLNAIKPLRTKVVNDMQGDPFVRSTRIIR